MASTLISLYRKYPDITVFRKRYKRAVNEDSIIFVGSPLHQNLGDHLIAEGTNEFLKDTFPDKDVFEVPMDVFTRNFIFLKRKTPAEAKVFITGGGLMGSLYPKYEIAIQQMLSSFSHCNLTILPQTIYYDGKTEGLLFNNSKKLMASCRNLKLCTREIASYEFAKANFDVNLMLVPDMALYYKTDVDEFQTAAGVCLRSDREAITSENVNSLKQLLEFYYDLKEVSTKAPKDIGFNERQQKLDEVIHEFATCPVILTDRFQAVNLSVLVGTKCIALKSRTGKIESSYETWLKWDKNIVMEDSNLDHTDMAEFLYKPYVKVNHEEVLKPAFDRLKEFVK